MARIAASSMRAESVLAIIGQGLLACARRWDRQTNADYGIEYILGIIYPFCKFSGENPTK
jgi:hypothetical protein